MWGWTCKPNTHITWQLPFPEVQGSSGTLEYGQGSSIMGWGRQWEWMSSQQDGVITPMCLSECTQTFHMPSSFTLLNKSGSLSLRLLDILPLPLLPFSLQFPHYQWLGVQGPVSYAPFFWNISRFFQLSCVWRTTSQIHFLFSSIRLLRPSNLSLLP